VKRGLSHIETREQAQEFGVQGAEKDIGPKRNKIKKQETGRNYTTKYRILLWGSNREE
jgi:hypothetical protein